MAIVEAASCGLQVVSTKVGGIPEVLPSDLVILTSPDTSSLILALEEAIKKHNLKFSPSSNQIIPTPACPFTINQKVSQLYNWENVSIRTEKIYRKILDEPKRNLRETMTNVLRSDVWLFLLVVALCHLIIKFLDWFHPREYIDICYDYSESREKSKEKNKEKEN